MRIIDGYRPQYDQVWLTFQVGCHCCSASENSSAVTEPVESSRRPPKEMTSPLPRIVADGYQWPSFMSLVLE